MPVGFNSSVLVGCWFASGDTSVERLPIGFFRQDPRTTTTQKREVFPLTTWEGKEISIPSLSSFSFFAILTLFQGLAKHYAPLTCVLIGLGPPKAFMVSWVWLLVSFLCQGREKVFLPFREIIDIHLCRKENFLILL